MGQKLFALSRSQRDDMWRRFKQSDDHRVAERLHAILLLYSGRNTDAVSSMGRAEVRVSHETLRTHGGRESPADRDCTRTESGCGSRAVS